MEGSNNKAKVLRYDSTLSLIHCYVKYLGTLRYSGLRSPGASITLHQVVIYSPHSTIYSYVWLMILIIAAASRMLAFACSWVCLFRCQFDVLGLTPLP